MFSFYRENQEQTQRICDSIIKIYCSSIQIPKIFYQNNPKLKQFIDVLELTAYKQKQLQEIVKDKISRPFELEIILGTELDLNQSIPNNWYNIFSLFQSEPNNDTTCKEIIFLFAQRILIKVNYQLKYLVNIYNSEQEKNDDTILSKIQDLFNFFLENNDYMNQTFYDNLSSFLGHVSYRWKSIFFNNSNILRKFAFSIFLSATKLVQYEANNAYNSSFAFIRDVFSQTYRNFTDFSLRPQLLTEFQLCLISIVQKVTSEQKFIVCQMICNLLQEAPTFLTSFSNALMNLKYCVLIFKDCLNGLQTETVISTFQGILEYVVWVIMKFPESSVLRNGSTLKFPRISFSEIDSISYAKKAVTLPKKVDSPLNSKFNKVPSILAEIIETNEEIKTVILKDIHDYLIKCQPTVHKDRFSAQIFREKSRYDDENYADLFSDSDDEKKHNKSSSASSDYYSDFDDEDEESVSDDEDEYEDENEEKDDGGDLWTPARKAEIIESSDAPSEYLHFRALLCFLIEVTRKIKDQTIFDFYFSNFEAFKKDWAPLFLLYIYPTHSIVIGNMISRCYKSVTSERTVILDEISYLIDNRNRENYDVSLLSFLPLINSLFLDSSDFGSFFVSSNLLNSLIHESKTSTRMFLLLITIIYKYPVECFTSSLLKNFLTDSFDDPAFHKIFVKNFVNGLKFYGQKKDSVEIIILLEHFTALLPILLEKKYGNSYDLIDIMSNTIPSFNTGNLHLFFKVGIVDLIVNCCKNDPSETMFRSAFHFLISLNRASKLNVIRMSDPKLAIFSAFSEIFEKNHLDFDLIDALFDLAIIPDRKIRFDYFKNKNEVSNLTFTNPMAITLIFKWIEGKDNEIEVVQQIYSMSEINVVNAFQLQKADIPNLILKRISKLNDKPELVISYFDLINSIWKQGLPVSDAYNAIEMMKTIRFPHMIIDSFTRLLRQEKKDQKIFFWLDGINSGFSETKISFDKSIDTLFISFQVFIYEDSKADKTLVFIQNEKNDSIEFGINGSCIYFRYNGKNKCIFKSKIMMNVWHQITFIVSSKKVRMILCENAEKQQKILLKKKKSLRFLAKDKKVSEDSSIPEKMYDPEVFNCSSFFSQTVSLFIGRRNDSTNFFSGLIGTIFVFNELISYNLYSQLSKLTVLNYVIPHLVAVYVPRFVGDNENICISSDLTAEFHGFVLNSYQTIHSVISSTKFLDFLLPFYSKMVSCKCCKGSEEYCASCGRLDKENGQKLLVSLTSIISLLLTFNSSNLANKSPDSIIELMSQYFVKIDPIFFTNDFVSMFDSLFEIAKMQNLDVEADIGQKMVEEIWLNYEMISKFPSEMQMRYFSTNLVKMFAKDEEGYKLFNSFTSYDFLIHKLLSFFINCDVNVAKMAWQITLECLLKKSMTTATASAILGLSFSPETAPVSEPIVNFIDLLEKTSDSHMLSVLQIFNSLLPFAIWASRPPLQSQRKALNYILGKNNCSLEEVKASLMQVAFLYEPPTPKDALFQTVHRHLESGCVDIYPLLIRVISNFDKSQLESNNEVISSVTSPGKYSKVPLFPYWILTLAEVYLKQDLKILDFSKIFGKFITLEFNEKRFDSLEKLRCLMLLYSSEQNIDFSPLILHVLEFLFDFYKSKNEKSTDILGSVFGNFFIHVFFESKITLNQPDDNFLYKYSDHFCTFSHKPQISIEFVNKYNSEFNQNILNDFISFLPKKTFEIRLSDNFVMESSQLIAYTLLKVCEKGANIDSTVNDFVKGAKNNKNALCIIRNFSCSATDKLKGDDPAQFLTAFELSFTMITPQLKHSIQNQFSIVTNEVLNFFLTTMNASIESKPSFSSAHRLLFFLHAIQSEPALKLLNIYKKYRQSTTAKFNNKKTANARKLTVFLHHIKNFCGPWFDSTGQKNLHFKIANTICIGGSRALMKVDNKYNFAGQIATVDDVMKPISSDAKGSTIPAKLLTLKSAFIGNIQTSAEALVFNGEFAHIEKKKISIALADILYVFQRTMPNGNTGVEIFVTGVKSYLFEICQAPKETLCTFIESNTTVSEVPMKKYNFFNELLKINGKKVQRNTAAEIYKLSGLFDAWNNRQITTYTYLFYLNIIAGRSINSLMMYPVFPWVLSDYTSATIDLENPDVYRDFSKPTFLLNDKQKKCQKEAVTSDRKSENFSHFSNPSIICNFLKRIEPFAAIDSVLNISLASDKSFASVAAAWEAVCEDVYDNRELTPEFFTNEFVFAESRTSKRQSQSLASAYTSTSNLAQSLALADNSFACFELQNARGEGEEEERAEADQIVPKVELPPWASGDPMVFVKMNMAALESDHTRRHIHAWIEAIFGVRAPLFVNKESWELVCDYDTKSGCEYLYGCDGLLTNSSEKIVKVFQDTGSFGISPQRVVCEPLPDPKAYFSIRPNSLTIPADQIFRMRDSYALQADFTLLNFVTCASSIMRPVDGAELFAASDDSGCVFVASPRDLRVAAVVFSKAPAEPRTPRRKALQKGARDSVRSSPSVSPTADGAKFSSVDSDCSQSADAFSSGCEVIARSFDIVNDSARVTAICVVDGADCGCPSILVAATEDGAVRRWSLPSLAECCASNAHHRRVVAVAGCFPLNLLVSLDDASCVVFESLHCGRLLHCARLPSSACEKSALYVFACGSVAVVQSSCNSGGYGCGCGGCVTMIDSEGRVARVREFAAEIQESDATEDALLVGYSSNTVELLEVPSLRTIAEYKGMLPGMKFCAAKETSDSFYGFNGFEIELLQFTKRNE